MTNPSYGKCYPFDAASGQQANQPEWRHLASSWGDGIINAAVSGAYGLSRSVSDRTVTLSLNADFRVRGITFEPTDATLPITVPSVSSGNFRSDLLVAKFDPTAKQISFYIKTGTETTGTPVAPGLTRNSGGVWEIELWRITGGSGAASTLTIVDLRRFVTSMTYVPDQRALDLSSWAIGSIAVVGTTGEYWRLGTNGTDLLWLNLDNPTWTNLTLPSGMTTHDATPQYRVVHGKVEMQGSIKRSSGNLTPAGGDSGVLLANLPATAWPSRIVRRPTAPYGYVLINTSGQVLFADRDANAFVNLDGVGFPLS